MMDVGRHPNIELLTNSEVKKVQGTAGNFRVKVLKRARYVNISECTACGECSKVCPIIVPNEFEIGLGSRKAIYQPFPQAVPSAYIRNADDCLGTFPLACARCAEVCEKNAIDYDEQDEMIEIPVGSIIVATGVDYYDPREASEFAYTRFQNVVTSIELERILSAGGPSRGELIKFTDRKTPKRIAFIQCVGSRNMKRDLPYCSRICCMNAMKDALIIHEHFPDAEMTIFYIDIRAFGKGFEEFFERAVNIDQLTFIRAKPSKVVEDPKTGDSVITYENTETGQVKKERVDLVVLSSALIPSPGSRDLAEIIGIETDKDGFFKQRDACAYPLDSIREGIFLAGCSISPKDITDSIAEASGAAVRASQYVMEAKLEKEEREITPLDVTGEPRIGVFVCHCGINIGGVIDVPAVAEYVRSLPNIVFSDEVLFACSASTQAEIQDRILEHRLNRVVVAACTPKTHEPIFQETVANVGLNPYLFEMVNIRDQCSWVHIGDPEKATLKAKDLIRMALAKVRLAEPLEMRKLNIDHDVLVIGGGITGMQTAIDLANRSANVHLVEREDRLGGRVSHLTTLYPSYSSGIELIQKKRAELERPNVTIYTNTELESVSGFVGNFDIQLAPKTASGVKAEPLRIGAIVVATGANLYAPEKGEFGYRKFRNVFTNEEFEQFFSKKQSPVLDNKPIKTVAYIQCIGSRGERGNPGCSRYCCQAAIKQAIALRKKGINVVIFHRDIRVYSRGAEEMYREARRLGVLFIPYEKQKPPKLVGKQRLETIKVRHPRAEEELEFDVDALVLSLGMVPKEDENAYLIELLKLQRSSDRFLMERHPKLGPVETSIEGIFLCGCAQGPKDIADSIAQASAVAAKVAAQLSEDTITLEPIVSTVNPIYCRACGKCVEVCEYHALEIQEDETGMRVAHVNEALCKGCGTCAAICPTGAIDVRHFKEEQIDAELEALLIG